ncbi:MAG: restriction endonuclease subunit S [Atopobium sp.]|nr:restriction endonuclease subunit S [Atopobium sp.]
MRPLASSWEQRKLGDVATRYDNLRIPITAKDRIPGDTPYYGANGIQDYVEGYTHEGEFVLVAEDGATDLDNYPVQLISGLSWVNNHAHVIKAIPDLAQNRFIMHLIKSMDIASYLVGGTRSKLNAEVLMGIELKLPSNSEQIYIGTLLSTLDSLITLHQRKYDKLCAVKKSMLDKMFPKPGEIEPEIRFAGFTDPWEQRKLGEISESYSGGTPSAGKDEYYGGDIPFIRSAEIADFKTELFLTEEGYKSSSAQMVKPGDILYALYGATSGEVAVSKQKGAINQAILAILPTEKCDASYLASWLRSMKQTIVATYLQGGQGNLSGAIVKELEVPLPCIAEQKHIGFLFANLDNLITLHQ